MFKLISFSFLHYVLTFVFIFFALLFYYFRKIKSQSFSIRFILILLRTMVILLLLVLLLNPILSTKYEEKVKQRISIFIDNSLSMKEKNNQNNNDYYKIIGIP